MPYLLYDTHEDWSELLPFTFTRPIAELRVGILTIAEKWTHYFHEAPHYQTEAYLHTKFAPYLAEATDLAINATLLPDAEVAKALQSLPPYARLVEVDTKWVIGYRGGSLAKATEAVPYTKAIQRLQSLTDIFKMNGAQIQADFQLLTAGRQSARITDPHTAVYGRENIFVEEGVSIKAAILNAENGVIYLGKHSQVSEGAILQGNIALGEHAVVNPGAKIRTDTTIGQYSKVGGEVSNSVLFGYSNKAHDGFLGNSVLGEWCNLGADTNNSNLKNNYSNVKIWNYHTRQLRDTGLQFCGLLMGDHSKAGINTMFNTGTVVGVSANIFGGGFPPKFIPSFSWGGGEGFATYHLEEAYQTAARVMARRGIAFTETDRHIFAEIARREGKH